MNVETYEDDLYMCIKQRANTKSYRERDSKYLYIGYYKSRAY